MRMVCKVCGKEFRLYGSEGPYCSEPCEDSANANQVWRHCKVCGGGYSARSDRVNDICCSKHCYSIDRAIILPDNTLNV